VAKGIRFEPTNIGSKSQHLTARRLRLNFINQALLLFAEV
ncbi:uncharacterized protein METZ01_LOCUS153590, partial [marine metagenome]